MFNNSNLQHQPIVLDTATAAKLMYAFGKSMSKQEVANQQDTCDIGCVWLGQTCCNLALQVGLQLAHALLIMGSLLLEVALECTQQAVHAAPQLLDQPLPATHLPDYTDQAGLCRPRPVLSVGLSVCLSACLSTWLSDCLSVCLPVCLCSCLPACLSSCLSGCAGACQQNHKVNTRWDRTRSMGVLLKHLHTSASYAD